MKKYLFSLDAENWTGAFETRDEAKAAAMENPEIAKLLETEECILYTALGEIVEKNILDYFNANEVFDMLHEKAAKEYGEQDIGGYPFDQVTRENRDLLERTVEKWADEARAHPRFTLITDIQPNPPDMPTDDKKFMSDEDAAKLEEFVKDHAAFVKACNSHLAQLRPMPKEARRSLVENLCKANGFIEIEDMYIHHSKVEKFKTLFLKKDDSPSPKDHAENAQPAQTENPAA